MIPDVHRSLIACLEGSPTCIGLFDAEDRLRFANASFLEALAVSLEGAPTWEAMMRACHRERKGLLIETDDIDAWLAKVRRSYRKLPLRTFDSDFVDGRWMSVTETLHDGGWVLIVACEVSHLKANEATLRQAHRQAVLTSQTDALTNLYNRRFVFDRLAELVGEAHSLRYPLTAALLDLDHFKQINDRHGHAAGDHVLVHFGQLLLQQLRPLDTAGRIGGEEFIVILPNTDAAGATRAIQRLRQMTDEGCPVPGQAPLRYCFSAGLTAVRPGETVGELFERADRALYRAKATGRGCSVVIDGE